MIKNDEVRLKFKLFNSLLVVYMRLEGSDVWVFNQILINGEYNYLLCLYREVFQSEPETIIDAGANVGFVTTFFKAANSKARILAIEPDKGNFKIALKNIEANFSESVLLQKAALWPTNTPLEIVNDFRDMNQWSLRVKEQDNGRIRSITPDQAIALLGNSVDVFKMDIEGGEAKIFDQINNLGWLKKVKIIAIEIHQEFGGNEKIIAAFAEYGFKVTYHGELIIGVKIRR